MLCISCVTVHMVCIPTVYAVHVCDWHFCISGEACFVKFNELNTFPLPDSRWHNL